MDPSISASISLVFGIAKFILDLSEVSEQSQVYWRLVNRVHEDLQETIRLLNLPTVQAGLDEDQDDKKYIEGTIQSAKTALSGIGRFIEDVRLDKDRNGTISLYHRANWVLTHQTKLTSRKDELAACHQSLLQAMSRMQVWKDKTALPSYDTAVNSEDYDGVLLSPRARKRAKEMRSPAASVNALDNSQERGTSKKREYRIFFCFG
jgi:hypothetical protein